MVHREIVWHNARACCVFTSPTAGSFSASVYLYLFTSNQLPGLVFPKLSLVWVGLVNITFSLPALIRRFTIVIMNIFKSYFKNIYIKSSGGESSGGKLEYSDLCLRKEESSEKRTSA